MRWKKVVISLSLVSIAVAFVLGLRLLYMGQPPSEVLKSVAVLLIFFLIPILGAIPALRRQETGQESQLRKRIPFAGHVAVLFLAPVLVGLVYYLTYPSLLLALPLAVVIVAGALLFSFLSR
ncbi:MAG: hypothetical protein ACE5Q6_20170 [Dehalococcoidia bacterium]